MDFSKEINAYIEKVVSESLKKINSEVALIKNKSTSTVQAVDSFAQDLDTLKQSIEPINALKSNIDNVKSSLIKYIELDALQALEDRLQTNINELETSSITKLDSKSKELQQKLNKEISDRIKAIKLPDYTEEFASVKKYIDEQVKSVLASKEVSSQATTVIRGGSGYAQVAQSGVKVKRRNTLNFIGATITDNAETGTTDITISGGGGGGAVDSVNGQIGVVVLDADDIDDTSTTHKFTTASDITKLAGIQAGAEVNVNADWNAVSGDAQILNKPTLAAVATSGAYADLSGTPTIPNAIFSTIAVSGQSNVVADSATDTLTLVAGTNVTITTNAATDSITINASGGGGSTPSIFYYGDGSDGNVTITGTTTLTRDMYYDTLTIASGGILETAMFKVFAKTAINIQSGGKIRCNGRNGNNATGQAGAATTGALYSGTLGGIAGSVGADGSTGTNVGTLAGSSANASPTFVSGIAGGGGAGGNGASSLGGAGSTNTNTGYREIKTAYHFNLFPITNQVIGGGTGIYIVLQSIRGAGGGGGGAGQAGGGGGGAAERGGIVFLCSPSITHNGTIECIGGNGGNGANAVGTNAGGGGGAGGGTGGFIVTLSETFTGSGTYNVSGGSAGTGGSGTGTGTAGSAGTAGLAGAIRRLVLNDNAIYTS